jgi:NAD(P)-dependent dehydrogenase (short-subunit alcohol dehydrogenase family)
MKNTTDKICMVTGATSGIGAAAARQLAHLGFAVIIVGRNTKKCLRQIKRIRYSDPDARVDFLQADLSSQRQVRQLAGEFMNRYSHLDILINNAGAIFTKRTISVEGLEMTFALNHMGYFLLTNLLLDHLKASISARIVMVSSNAHEQGSINFEDLQSEHNYNRIQAYAQSKLANLLFTYALARRLEGTCVTANALHPGIVATNYGSNNSWLRTKLRNLLKPRMISPKEGAKTIVYLATSTDVEGITGKYFYDCRAIRSSSDSYDVASAEKLWLLSEMLAGLSKGQTTAQLRLLAPRI